VRLGFGGGNAHATEEKPANAGKYLQLGIGTRSSAVDGDDEEEDYGDHHHKQQQQGTRWKLISRLLLDHDKSKNGVDYEMLSKEGSRGFMGSVRRISLVGRHRRAQSGGGIGVVLCSPGPPGVGGWVLQWQQEVIQNKLCHHRCRILSRLSRLQGNQFVIATS